MTRHDDKIVVVFGATGGLGVYLVEALAAQGYRVIGAGRREPNRAFYGKHGIDFCQMDIQNTDDFKKLPGDSVYAVLHLAGAMPARMEGYEPRSYIRSNIEGTLNVLDYTLKTRADRIVFTQSHSDVAGHWNTGEFIPPDATRKLNLTGDHAVYIISKNAAVDLIQHYHYEFDLRTIVLRLPTVYCYSPVDYMYVSGKPRPIAYLKMIQKAIAGEKLEIWGNPNTPKDIVYVKDFNQLVVRSLESPKAQGFYNVGTGKPTTLEDQIRGIAKVFCSHEKPSPIEYCPEKPGQVSYLYDIENAREDLGYEPKFTYVEMLEDMKWEMNSDRFPVDD